MYIQALKAFIFAMMFIINKPIIAASSERFGNISEALTLDKCPQGWIDEYDTSFSGVITGNRSTPCAYWKDVFGKGFSALSASVHVNGIRLPVVVFFNNYDIGTSNRKINRIIIKLNGGPSGAIGPSSRDGYIARLSSPGTIFVTLGYTGTYYGSLYPNNSFNAAALEFSGYIKQVHLNRTQISIYAIAESLGGRIAAYALRSDQKAQDYTCRLILVAPMARSPLNAIDYAEKDLSSSGKPSTKIYTRTIPDVSVPWSGGKITNIPSILLLKAFFPSYLNDKNLRYIVSSLRRNSVDLIYGSSDNVAAWKELNLINSGSIHSRRVIPQMGHIPDDQQIRTVVYYVKEDISSSCDNKP